MKSKLKIITAFIIGVLVSGITVYAANKIYSNQVEIDKTGGKLANINGTKLQDALDYLYSQVGKCPEGYTCSIARNPGYLPENDNNTYSQSTFVQNLKVGDLIKMIPIISNVSVDPSRTGWADLTHTGYIGTITIDPSELKMWRVIRKNSNGTVDVISEYTSSQDIVFSGVIGYANFVGYLNELASYYENSNYTIGSRYMGYNGQINYLPTTRYISGDKKIYSSSLSSTRPSDEVLGAGDMGYQTDYNLVQAVYSNVSSYPKAYKVGTTAPTNYWIGSREYSYNDDTHFYFRGRCVTLPYGWLSTYEIRYYNGSWNDNNSYAALRPILTLKADVAAISGDGKSEETAYVLG